jgi:hypothetical protein
MEAMQNAYILGRHLTDFNEMESEETDSTNLLQNRV